MTMSDRPQPLPFVCTHCFTQYDTPPPAGAQCPCCRHDLVSTAGWDKKWAKTLAHVMRECLDTQAWLPGNWLEHLAAEHMVKQGVLHHARAKPLEDSPQPKTNDAYAITYMGRAFLSTFDKGNLPNEVSTWHEAGVMLIARLQDQLAQLKDGAEGEASEAAERAELLVEYLQKLLRDGHDMMAARYPYTRTHSASRSITIESSESA